MSFADIINQEQKKVEEGMGGSNNKVEYPETKHKRLFFQKDQREILMQILPASNLVGAFAEPVRKIFLTTRTSQGKELKVNFTLAADEDHGSLLERKVKEWADKGMIPNGFGGQQTPKRVYLVNAVQIMNLNGQYVQERDQQGNLVVRVFEMPQSAYANLLRKLADPLYNSSGTEFSFMDVNKPAPVKISKPAKGQMEYPVDVYAQVPLPPLGQGWENQLEDLQAQAVATERLVNGAEWVQAFVDMKEGRKPNQNGGGDSQGQAPQAPQANPYAAQGAQPQPQPQYQVPQTPQAPPATQPDPGMGGMIGTEADLNSYNMAPQAPQQPQYQVPQTPQAPQAPQQTMPNAPQQPAMPNAPQQPINTGAQQPPAAPHNVDTNSNGLQDIDAMLEAELGNN